jgi:hypothetical protein
VQNVLLKLLIPFIAQVIIQHSQEEKEPFYAVTFDYFHINLHWSLASSRHPLILSRNMVRNERILTVDPGSAE